MFTLPRRLVSEFLGTAFLLMGVVGSGIMGTNLSPDDGVALLANMAATGAILSVLIMVFGPVSGAQNLLQHLAWYLLFWVALNLGRARFLSQLGYIFQRLTGLPRPHHLPIPRLPSQEVLLIPFREFYPTMFLHS